MKTIMDELLEFNALFVSGREYERYKTDKLPDLKLAVLSCMDTRLTHLLPAALNFSNGDVKMIKNAGALANNPFGGAMRSILVSIYDMGVQEVAVIGHYDCGMRSYDPKAMQQKMMDRGVSADRIETVKRCGIDLDKWLGGFSSSETSVRETVRAVREHPLIPSGILVHGFLINPETGAVDRVSA